MKDLTPLANAAATHRTLRSVLPKAWKPVTPLLVIGALIGAIRAEDAEDGLSFAKVFAQSWVSTASNGVPTAGMLQIDWTGSDFETSPAENVESHLFGRLPKDAKDAVLEIALEGINKSNWELLVADGDPIKDPQSYSTRVKREDEGHGARWAWSQRIRLKPITSKPGEPASATSPSSPAPPVSNKGRDLRDLPVLRCTLKNGDKTQSCFLLPADVWVLAGGGCLLEKTASPPGGYVGILNGGEGNAMLPQKVSKLACEFAARWQQNTKRPVGIVVQAKERALLADMLPDSYPAKISSRMWLAPGERDSAPNAVDAERFAARGLIWWHGDWEAETSGEARDPASWADLMVPPVPGNAQSGKSGLRARYAKELAETILKPWWESMSTKVDFDAPHEIRTDYLRALQLLIVQLPPIRRQATEVDPFIRLWEIDALAKAKKAIGEARTETDKAKAKADEATAVQTVRLFKPVSTSTAIRFAQFDVVRQLQILRAKETAPFGFLNGTVNVPYATLCRPKITESATGEPSTYTIESLAAELANSALNAPALPTIKRGPDSNKITLSAVPDRERKQLLMVRGSEVNPVASTGAEITLPADSPAPTALRTPVVDDQGDTLAFDFPLPLPP